MRIEIDQSGKIENTGKPTVIGFANDKCKSIIILACEKQKLLRKFYKIGKPKVYRYQIFALLIFILLKDEKHLSHITFDTEYPGKESLIKSYLLNYFRKTHRNLGKKDIIFRSIGKSSKAHEIVNKSYRKKRADTKIICSQVLKYLQ